MIGIGVIGYGYWGPNLARCVAETDGCRLVGGRRLLGRGAGARRQALSGGLDCIEDWRDADRRSRRSTPCSIATPVATHFELALAALRAGKHVLVEKPMAATSDQARRLIEEAARRNLVLMVDHTFVYTSAVQKIGELIAQRRARRVYYYDSTRVNLGLFQRDVNVIWDLAVHDLSILDYLLQREAGGGLGQRRRPHPRAAGEHGASHLFYPSAAPIAHLNVNWLAPVKVRQTLIGGSRKMIVYDDLEPSEKIKVYDRGVTLGDGHDERSTARVSYRSGDMWAPQLSVKEALLTEMEHFVDCVDQRAGADHLRRSAACASSRCSKPPCARCASAASQSISLPRRMAS